MNWEPAKPTVTRRVHDGDHATTILRPTARRGIPDQRLAVYEHDSRRLVFRRTPRTVWLSEPPTFDLEALWYANRWKPTPTALRIDWAANEHAQVTASTTVDWAVACVFADDVRYRLVERTHLHVRLPWSALNHTTERPDNPGQQLELL